MHYEITQHGDMVDMRVLEIGDRGPQLLASMQQCQEGDCSCPTDQYDRLDSIDTQPGDDAISITLRPTPGEQLDVSQLAACLDHTIAATQAE